MAHIPDDDFDDFMNSDAEDWSKPEEPTPPPQVPETPVDRWGAPLPDDTADNDGDRWGAPELDSSNSPNVSDFMPKGGQKGSSKWWIIAIIVAVVLCLCVCVVVFGLPMIGVSLFGASGF